MFAASADPGSLDPAFASDGESFRVARQIFEGLVGIEPGTADPAPLLAECWDVSDDGLEYTFHLKEGVKFHDDTDFNAEAVCFNFERWNNFTGARRVREPVVLLDPRERWLQSSDNEALNGTGKYESLRGPDDATAVIHLKSPLPELVPALSLPSFSMQSPTALEEYDADDVSGARGRTRAARVRDRAPDRHRPVHRSTRGRPASRSRSRPTTTTGASRARSRTIVFPIISDATARRQALRGRRHRRLRPGRPGRRRRAQGRPATRS